MAEKTITETYTRETRRRLYDQANRHIDDNLSAGRSRLMHIETPVRSEKSYTSTRSNENRDVKHLLQVLIETVKELKKDKEPKVEPAVTETKQEPAVPNPEIEELKKAIESLSQRIAAIPIPVGTVEEKEKQKQEKHERRKRELSDILETQKMIQEQLAEQKDILINIDADRKEADQILRDDVTEALTEHKQMTDNAVQELARKVSDLISDNAMLKKNIDELRKNLEDLYVEESEDERKKPTVSRQSSSCSSCSAAVILPPAAIKDGRRPSQAYHISTIAPAEELADQTAKKVLEDATRISVSRM